MKKKMIYILGASLFLIIGFIILAGIFLPSIDPSLQKDIHNFKSINGTLIHYYFKKENPDKPTLVFLHSFGGNLEMWKSLFPYFNEFNILAYDMPGFGKSEKKLDDYSLEIQTNFLYTLLNELKVDSVILIGSSMGASTAVWFTADKQNMVKKLIIMSPSGYPGSMNHKFPGNYFYKPGFLNTIGKLMTSNFIFRKLFPNSIAFQAFSVTSSYDQSYIEILKKINIPVLIFWSRGDKRTLYQFSEQYLKLIKNSKLITVPDIAGHNVNSFNPEFVSKEIKNFIVNK